LSNTGSTSSDKGFNDLGQLGELRFADYSDATGRYWLLIADTPPARALVTALGLQPGALPGLGDWLAVPYTRAVDALLVDAVQVIGHLIYGRHDLRQLTFVDDGGQDGDGEKESA